jgi:hypothetical protein
MLDYAKWLERAAKFTEHLRNLPGEIKIQIEVAPPLSEGAIRKLAESCRLPIPQSLQRFWKEASGHCNCTYWWDTPQSFHKQMLVAFPHWSLSHIWGGPQFESASDIVELADSGLAWAGGFRGEYPKDARFWEYSIPVIPVGNGDYVGLYTRDNAEDPPVVFLCHEGCGASGVIAPDLDEFLRRWEQLGYIGIHFVSAFLNPKTGWLDPEAYPAETEACRALLRGQLRSDLVKPPPSMTASEWLSCSDPDTMLKWLKQEGKMEEQKLRLFACACCRRVWNQMGQCSRKAVEVAERYANGFASEAELQAARTDLSGGEKLAAQIDQALSPSDDTVDPKVWEERFADPFKAIRDTAFATGIQRFMEALGESVNFSKTQGLMHRAACSALEADSNVCWEINQHLDEPELGLQKAAQADLVRRFFGNPFAEGSA